MKKKNILYVIVLLFIVWMAYAGSCINKTGNFCNNSVTFVFTSTFIMCFVPSIVCFLDGKLLEPEIGEKIIKWNSIIILLISILISFLFINTGQYIGIGIPGAVVYYYINKFLFIKTEKKNKAKKIKKVRNKNINIIVIISLLVNFCLTIMLVSTSNKNKALILKQNNLNQQIGKYESVENNLNYLIGDNSVGYVKNKLEFFDNNIVFVIKGYENYYFTYDCMKKKVGLSSYSYWAYNKEQVIGKGYKKYNGLC